MILQWNLMISADFLMKSDDLHDMSMKFDKLWLFFNEVGLFLMILRWNLMIFDDFSINLMIFDDFSI